VIDINPLLTFGDSLNKAIVVNGNHRDECGLASNRHSWNRIASITDESE